VAPGLAAIDWQAAWLAPFAGIGKPAAGAVASGAAVCESLNAAQAAHAAQAGQGVVRFVAQSALPAGQAYEAFIFASGQCPTRDNLHDFFNGLCWLHFPETKKRLNQLQARHIAQDGVGQVRGPVRDALTVFDENAAFLQAPQALWQALVQKDWATVFGAQRALWQEARLVVFGHALLEKLASPRKGITAHVYRVHPATGSLADWDHFVATDLSAEKIAGKPFAHLPVLGVPGWWPENENPAFYDDASVFRPSHAALAPRKT
jgi:Protein of unknown function (DUF3025)